MSSKPTLSLSTPVTANFPHIPPPPSELRSAVSLPSAVETPLSAISRTSAFRDPLPSSGLPSAGLPSAGPFSATLKFEYDMQKTPITPPVAYLDFLKSMSLVSPCLTSPPHTGKAALNRTSTASASSTVSSASASSKDSTPSSVTSDAASLDDGEKEKIELIESGPSTARSDVNSECGDDEKTKEREKSPRPSPISIKSPPTPVNSYYPLSAPLAGPSVFPSMKLPTSPAVSASGLYSPRSPLSAASVHSPFDWDAALKAKRFSDIPGAKRPAAPETPTVTVPAPTHAKRESRSSIRHIREVVTRTVTYTPRMAPAPKGKRRKLDSETTPKS